MNPQPSSTARPRSSKSSWKIRDVDGCTVAIHVRRDTPEGKTISWRGPDGTVGLGGIKPADLPLYGSHDLAEYGPDELVVVVEGEKVRDALADIGISSVGTVTGASGTPSQTVLEALRGRRVVLWPDNDEPGRMHMQRIGERLSGVAGELLIYDWPEAENKGDDAADHPATQTPSRKAVGQLRTDLDGAPRFVASPSSNSRDAGTEGSGPNRLLQSRVLLAEGMVNGIEPPEELEPGVLIKGKVHWLYAPGGAGKTTAMLWLIKRRVERAERVLLLDSENGKRIISERLVDMGVAVEAVDEYLFYLSSPSLTLADAADYAALLDELKPALVVFDSLISFLAGAGCEENSATDVATWAVAFCHPARQREVAVLLLDHVPHDGAHARGSTRKRDEADVIWKLHKTQDFDRERVGEIVLFREKDREAWLPPSVKFSVGGAQGGFLFERSEGTVEEPTAAANLSALHEKVYVLLKAKGREGATWGELKRGFEGSTGTLSNALKKLRELNRCKETENPKRYYALEHVNPIDKADSDCSIAFNECSTEHIERDVSETVQPVHHLYGGEQLNTDVEHRSDEQSVPVASDPRKPVTETENGAGNTVTGVTGNTHKQTERELGKERI